ncbi:MAG: hypothetical protein H6707_04225 [Deltaproteobacteria bacterium]|nr:hypothetical protein [Deltaproteobacteria bacterium]
MLFKSLIWVAAFGFSSIGCGAGDSSQALSDSSVTDGPIADQTATDASNPDAPNCEQPFPPLECAPKTGTCGGYPTEAYSCPSESCEWATDLYDGPPFPCVKPCTSDAQCNTPQGWPKQRCAPEGYCLDACTPNAHNPRGDCGDVFKRCDAVTGACSYLDAE